MFNLLNENVKLNSVQADVVVNPVSLNTNSFHTSQLYQNTGTVVDSVNSVISNLNHKHAMCYLDTSLRPTRAVNNGDTLLFKSVVSDPFNTYNSATGVITCPVTGLITIRLNGYTLNGGMDLQVLAKASTSSGDVSYNVYRCYATAPYYTVTSNFAYFGKSGDQIKLVVSTPSAVTLPYDLQLSLTWG
jgi:hypothetical protein